MYMYINSLLRKTAKSIMLSTVHSPRLVGLGISWRAGLVMTPGSVETEGTVREQLLDERVTGEAKSDTRDVSVKSHGESIKQSG